MPNNIPHFLNAAGEMAELTRAYNWDANELGTPDKWPYSLQTTVSNVLRSKFPMFLWWGESMIQFYNDAYRPSLGIDGKHPTALGQKGFDCWPEIWPIIYPLIEQVRLTDLATWQENQLIPIYRNGKIEEVYWTFSYSSVLDDDGNHGGILVTCMETTQQVITKNQVAKSESNLRNIILQAPVAMCILHGPEFRVQIANEIMYRMWGRPSGMMEGKPLFEVLPEVKNQGFEERLLHVYTTGETYTDYSVAVQLPRNNNTATVYINFVYEAYRELNDEITAVMVVAYDVTEQVLGAKKIEESAQLVRSVVESAPFPIGVYTGREMRITMVNQSIIDTWGKGNNVIGKLYSEVLPELAGQNIYSQLDHVYNTGEPFHARHQRVDLEVNGKLQKFYFNYSFTPLFDSDAHVFGIMNTAADVTDLVTALQQVEQSEANFRNIILQAPVAMCILVGREFIIEISNDQMIEIWDKRKEEVLNKPVFEVLPNAKAQGLEELLNGVYQNGETYKAEERPIQRVRDGRNETAYHTFVCQPYRNRQEEIIGVLVITIDVTWQVIARRKIEVIVAERTSALAKANESLQHMNQELLRSNSNLEQFAYAASHDLKEPIRKIHLYSDRLRNNLNRIISDDDERYFAKIQEASLRMGSLIDNVLAYSQLSSKERQAELVDLNTIIQGVLADLELEIESKKAIIETESLFKLNGHSSQLHQAFQNLVSNALKYSKPDETPRVKISYSRVSDTPENLLIPAGLSSQGFHMVAIADNGTGFDPSHAEKIFQVFTRLHDNAVAKGTGVGLAIVRKVIENHNGFILAQTIPGEGSTFKIYFPVEVE